jgi:hypothetical protein
MRRRGDEENDPPIRFTSNVSETEIPIACSLTGSELQQRRANYLDKIAAQLTGTEELENGFSFRFRLGPGFLQDLAEVIDLERQCCPFLNFRTILRAGDTSALLELTGPEGTKDMVRELFNWN